VVNVESYLHVRSLVWQSLNHEYRKIGNFTIFNESLSHTAPLLENALKLSLRPFNNWKFEPSPRAHTHSVPIINKHPEMPKLRMVLSWRALNSMIQVKHSVTLKSEDLATYGF